jgi:TonB family protein
MVARLISVGFAAIFMTLLSTSPATSQECPVYIKSLLDAGHSASGSFVSYHIRIGGNPGTIASIALGLKTSNASGPDAIVWKDVTIPPKRDKADDPPTLVGTFDRRTDDVVAASIVRVVTTEGTVGIACDLSWSAFGGSEEVDNLFGVIDDKTHPFDPNVESHPPQAHDIVDSQLLYRQEPVYPAAAENGNLQGDVTIRVTIDEHGKPSKVSIEKSSQDDGMDLAALVAARQSTFKPPLIDGKPTSRDYLLVYTFRMDAPAIGLPVPKPTCAMNVEHVQLVNAGQPYKSDWIKINLSSKRADVTSAVFGLLVATRGIQGEEWTDILLPQPDSKTKLAYANVFLAWVGDDILKVWVDSIKLADGSRVQCETFYALVDRPHAAGKLPRTTRTPSRLDGIFNRNPDPPIAVTYPKYPAAELASGTTGDVGVDALADNSGSVVGAFVEKSSDNAALDESALQAAMRDRYPASHSKSDRLRIFYVDYEFMDQPW